MAAPCPWPCPLSDEGCAAATSADYISDEAKHLGLDIAYDADCVRNYRNCYAKIGGVEWLPAVSYLSLDDMTTREYLDDGLCNHNSTLYNQLHCATCRYRREQVSNRLAWLLIVTEHIFLMAQIFAKMAVPSKPNWVVTEEAKKEHVKEELAQESLAHESVAQEQAEASPWMAS